MAYIGAVAPGYDPTRASVPQLDAERFSGNTSTTAFTLVRQVVSPTDIDVYVENVKQEPTVAYSVSGYTLNFTEAPNTGTNNVYVIYRGSATSNYAYVPDGSITYAKLANNIKQFTVDTFTANGTGSTVALTEAPASANAVIVSVDGVIQTAPTNYTLSGSTITFTGVPDSGANVVVKHIGFRTTSTVTALQAGSVTATELADGSVTNVKIDSVANTKISGNIISSQITSVANTQLTGTITGSQISSNTLSNTVFQTGSVENYMNSQNLGFGMRNRIINGAMVIDQRNAGASVTPTNGQFLTDRFGAGLTQASKFTAQQSTTAPTGFINSQSITSSSAYSITSTDKFWIYQPIEGLNIADLAWGTASASTVTLSFWVRSSLTGTFGGSLQNNAQNRSYPFSYTINSANTFEQKTITIAGDTSGTWLTTNGTGIYLNIGLGVGSTFSGTAGAWAGANYFSATGATSVVGTNGATFYITGVQLEKGSTATSFDYRPYTTELQLAQRYYWRIGGSQFGGAYMPMVLFTGISTTSLSATIQLPVKGRTPPSSIILGGSAPSISAGSISTNLALDRNSYDSVMVYILGTGFAAGTSYRWIGNPDATTFLGFEGMEL
jgi:hypothetical protein